MRKTWQPYLLGHKFIICNDQRSLKYLLELRIEEGEHHKWLLKLLGYNFDIQYEPGKENTIANTLFRVLVEMISATTSLFCAGC